MIGSENILHNHVRRAHLITLIMPSGGGGKHQYDYIRYSHLGPPIAAKMQK